MPTEIRARIQFRKKAGNTLLCAIASGLCLLLCISAVLTSIAGCREGAPSEAIDVPNKEPANSDIKSEIAALARKEVIKRGGWTGQFDVKVRKTKSGWWVTVWRLPRVDGGFADVEISSDRKVVGYYPGK